MAALKAQDVDRYVARPDPTVGLILLYGPDQGLISERSGRLLAALGARRDDPFSFITLDGDAVAQDSARLIDEATTRSMFGDKRYIRVRLESKPIHAAVQELAKARELDAFVIIEGGDLKKGAPLRTLIEGAAKGMALPCYQDSKQQIGRLIDEELALGGMRMEVEARQLLIRSLGGDREASRAEIRKLCLYAHGQASISARDVAAICGDASAFAMSALIDAAFSGMVADIEHMMRKTEMEAISPQAILAAAQRQASGLHKAALAQERRQPLEATLRHVDPTGIFSRKPAIEKQIRLWSANLALWAMDKIADATADSRMSSTLAAMVTHRALIVIAERARRQDAR